ncbi:MAG TPA: class I SAM-dependent methyltransferase [Mucilaginibacter sp.]|jgi:ubiquinone/menaquinone biosynthesis C-methylase UbiE
MAANYNNSAWFYDKLSLIVYGRAIINAQVYLLRFIKPNSHVLIVGGGTGWILEEMAKVYPSGLEITYVEASANMMARSKKRHTGLNKIIFVNDIIEDAPLSGSFDAVITAFLFDNFTEETLKKIFDDIHKYLKRGGLWLNADFQLTGKLWQTILLKSMHLFFKLLCNIEASKLPDIENQFKRHGYESVAQQTFFSDFIISKAYRKYQTSEV